MVKKGELGVLEGGRSSFFPPRSCGRARLTNGSLVSDRGSDLSNHELQGLNPHLTTRRADPLNLEKTEGVIDGSRGRGAGGEELLPLPWGRPGGFYELTINRLCWFPEWRIETDCLAAIELRSSAP